MKLLTLTALLLTTVSASATEYQSFSSLSYSVLDTAQFNSTSYGIESTYYLDKKLTLGPLDELEYINKVSNVFGNALAYNRRNIFPNYSLAGVGGEFFIDKLLVGGSYNYFSDGIPDSYSLQLGYLLSDDLLIKATVKNANSKTFYNFLTSYNYQINKRDYIGFTYDTDDNFYSQSLKSKYFNALGGDKYFITEVYYLINKNRNNNLGASVSYYFNAGTSIAASYDNNDYYTLSAKYFINKNYAISAGYKSNVSFNNKYNLYSLNLIVQF